MTKTKGYLAYTQSNTEITKPEKLIEMLYEGELRFISLAKRAIENGDMESKIKWINRSTEIFVELINSINYDGVDVAHYLSGLYNHQVQLLSKANINNTTEELDIVLNVVKTLLETWKEETTFELAS